MGRTDQLCRPIIDLGSLFELDGSRIFPNNAPYFANNTRIPEMY